MKKITDAKSLSSVTHGTVWFKIERKSKRLISDPPIHVRKVFVMHCIDFLLFLNFVIFERTVVAASDFNNCTMVHCDAYLNIFF